MRIVDAAVFIAKCLEQVLVPGLTNFDVANEITAAAMNELGRALEPVGECEMIDAMSLQRLTISLQPFTISLQPFPISLQPFYNRLHSVQYLDNRLQPLTISLQLLTISLVLIGHSCVGAVLTTVHK